MRAIRTVLCAASAGLVAVAAPPTHAAKPKPPAPACNLLTDVTGDGHPRIQGGSALNSPVADIVGADVATGAKTVVGVLRLASTESDTDVLSKPGVKWTLMFDVGTGAQATSHMFARVRAAGPAATYTDTLDGAPVLRAATTATTITWTADRSKVPALSKRNAVVSRLVAESQFVVGAAGQELRTSVADVAAANVRYADRYPSCLKPA